MLKSFAHEEAEEIYHGIHSHAIRKLLPAHLVKVAERKLDILNCAESLESLALLPTLRPEIARDAHGKYSIPIEGSWRIAFKWNGGPAEIEIKS
jgi:plasmid maintenance system killer protein